MITSGRLGAGFSEIGGRRIYVDGFLSHIPQELVVNRAYASANIQKACIPYAQSSDGFEKFARLTRGTFPTVAASLVGGLLLAERTICDLTAIARQPYILPAARRASAACRKYSREDGLERASWLTTGRSLRIFVTALSTFFMFNV